MNTEFQPYVGPKPFEETDKDLFFGRDAEANDLFSLIVAHPAVLVYAQSGAGKTSLLNAKIVPALKSKGYEVLPLSRVQGLQPKKGSNIYVFNTLVSWADGQKSGWSDLDGVSLADFLKKRPHVQKIRETSVTTAGNGSAYHNLRASSLNHAHTPDSEESAELWELPRVAVFDQFEELFTSYPNRWPEREEFFTQIRAALDDDYLLRVVFMMREDYIAELDPYLSLLPGNLRVRTRLERLNEKSALEAVVKPLQKTNREFGKGVAPALVQNLLKSANNRPGVEQFVEAVQLQVVCQNLWQSLEPSDTIITMRHLKDCGDVTQALMSFYEQSIRTIVSRNAQSNGNGHIDEGDVRRWFEKVLITPERKRATVDRRAERTGGMPNDTVIDPLERVQLIKGEWRAGSRWYELSHDRFIEPILTSNERWLVEQTATEQIRQRLESRAIEYGQGIGGLLNQDELIEAKRLEMNPHKTKIAPSVALRNLIQASLAPQQQRKMRFMWLGVTALLVVMVAMGSLTGWAMIERGKATSQRVEADNQKNLALRASQAAKEQKSKAVQAEAEAKQQRDEAESAKRDAKRAQRIAEFRAQQAQAARRQTAAALANAKTEKSKVDEQLAREQKRREADGLANYGDNFSYQGDFVEAQKYHDAAIRMYEEIKDTDGKANMLSRIGGMYSQQARTVEGQYKQKRYDEAEKYFQQAIELRENMSKDNALARMLNAKAVVIDSRGNYSRAEPLYETALKLRQDILAPSHPDLALSYRNLASLHQNLGEYAEAERLTKKALDIDIPNKASDNIIRSTGQLGAIRFYQGRYAEAESFYKQALEKANSQPESAYVGTNSHNLALLYLVQGKYELVDPLERKAIDIDKKVLPENHDSKSTRLMVLARLFREQGKYVDAEPLYQQALDEAIKGNGPEHSRVATFSHYLAQFYAAQSKYELAERLEKRAMAIFENEEMLKPDNWFKYRSVGTLAMIYAGTRREKEAESLYKQSAKHLEQLLGPDHPETANSLAGLAELYLREKRYEEAEPLIRRALDIREKSFDSDHPDVAGSLNDLGKLYRDQGRYSEAEKYFTQAIAINEKRKPNHLDFAQTLEDYALLLRKTNRPDEAASMEARAKVVRDKFADLNRKKNICTQ